MNEVETIATEVKEECEEIAHKIEGGVSFGEKVVKAVKAAKAEEPQAEAQLKKFLDDFKTIEPTLAGALTSKGLNLADDTEAYSGLKTLLADGEALCATAEAAVKQVESAA